MVLNLVPKETTLALQNQQLATLNALTGSKFIMRHLQQRVRSSDVMVLILSYLEPENFMIFEKLSKKFFNEHLPSTIQARK